MATPIDAAGDSLHPHLALLHAVAHHVAGAPTTPPHQTPTPGHLVSAVPLMRATRAAINSAQGLERAVALRNIAATAAHDLEGSMFQLDSNLELLDAEWLSADAAEALGSMHVVALYLHNLTRELRIAAEDADARATDRELHLSQWWPGMSLLLGTLRCDGVTIDADFPKHLPGVCVKPHHLTQIFLTLVANALQAIAYRPPPAPGAPPLEKGAIDIYGKLSPRARAVTIAFTDNGVSMTQEAVMHVFDPRFVCKGDQGTAGSGLTVVRQLLCDIGGTISLSSASGTGTIVVIELPIRDEHKQTLSGMD